MSVARTSRAWPLVVLGLLIAMATLVLTPGSAQACSCRGFGEHSIELTEAAYVIVPTDFDEHADGSRTYQADVIEVFKGDVEPQITIDVSSPEAAGTCGWSAPVLDRAVGMVGYSSTASWGLCGWAQAPHSLAAYFEPITVAGGAGEPGLFFAPSEEPGTRIQLLDGMGRPVMYGTGSGYPYAIDVCPGGMRTVELASSDDTPGEARLVTRDAATLQIVADRPVLTSLGRPAQASLVVQVTCLRADLGGVTTAYIIKPGRSSGGESLRQAEVRVDIDGETSVLTTGRSLRIAPGRDGGSIFVYRNLEGPELLRLSTSSGEVVWRRSVSHPFVSLTIDPDTGDAVGLARRADARFKGVIYRADTNGAIEELQLDQLRSPRFISVVDTGFLTIGKGLEGGSNVVQSRAHDGSILDIYTLAGVSRPEIAISGSVVARVSGLGGESAVLAPDGTFIKGRFGGNYRDGLWGIDEPLVRAKPQVIPPLIQKTGRIIGETAPTELTIEAPDGGASTTIPSAQTLDSQAVDRSNSEVAAALPDQQEGRGLVLPLLLFAILVAALTMALVVAIRGWGDRSG